MSSGLLVDIPEELNLTRWCLGRALEEGRGDRLALRTDTDPWSYADLDRLASRFGNLLRQLDVRPEERVLLALPDGPEWAGAFFGTIRAGCVSVMVNPYLKPEQLAYFVDYSRARAAVVHRRLLAPFLEGAGLDHAWAADPEATGPLSGGVLAVPPGRAPHLSHLLVVGDPDLEVSLESVGDALEPFPSHRDDPAAWLFSGGTTGKPKGVVQSHASFVNTTRRYGHGVLGLGEDDVTISVPKLFFGYATGSNLIFPLSVGASAVLFGDRCTPEALFERIARHRPTVLVNVPTMVSQMVDHPEASERDLSSLRVATSAGEALSPELYERWKRTFGVELLDGLGTAEQWHIFLSNRLGEVKPGTLGRPVPGFDVKLCDESGVEVEPGEVGELWVRGGSRAIGYWQRMERTMEVFRGEWVVTGDMLRVDEDGAYVYSGRDDDMLKVSGKWLSPGEVENVLMEHPAVKEVAVVGVEEHGLVVPVAWVIPAGGSDPDPEVAAELEAHVCSRIESYKCPRRFQLVDDLPRTHLGKIDRGRLKSM